MKPWHLGVSIAAIIAFGFLLSQDSLARIAFDKYGRPDLALILVRNDAELSIQLGNYYFNGGAYDLKRAELAYQKALASDQKMQGPRYQLSRIAFLQGDFPKALGLINEEMAFYPDFKRSHYLRGLIYGYSGNLDKAAEEFHAFLEWDGKSWAAHNDLAWIYFRQGRFADAQALARQGLGWNPNNPWLLTTLGASLLNLNKKTEAKAVLETALRQAEQLSAEDWGRAYPGNDPRTYTKGFQTMHKVIRQNLRLAN